MGVRVPPSTPPWLAIVLAVIALIGVMFGPALAERVKRGPKPSAVPDPHAAADRADAALAIVQDAMDDLQRRLNERDREVAELRRRLEKRRRDDAS
jgi:hypothetical protein